MRAFSFALGLALVVAGCTRPCKSNTVFVSVTFDSASATATSLQVSVTVSGTTRSHTLAHTPGVTSGSIEVDFSAGYPTGKPVTVAVQAIAGGKIVGGGMGSVTAGGSCQSLNLSITRGGGAPADMSASVGDMMGDLSGSAGDMPIADLMMLPPDFAGCTTVFVSASTGSNANSGCDPTSPKQTISAGLGVSTARDVVVCKGTYNEDVTVTRNLHGGYNCSTWARTATFGYPTFDGTNETIIQGQTGGSAALLVNTANVSVDGFTVKSQNGAAMTSIAASISAAQAVTLKDCNILGGGTASTDSSLGLDLNSNGDDVFHNLINGGSGHSTTNSIPASLGVHLAGQSHLHDNTIIPGAGNASGASGTRLGAIGILIDSGNSNLNAANNTAVEHNNINSGSGNAGSTAGSFLANIGICVAGTITGGSIDLTGNVIDAGSGVGPNAGVQASGSPALTLTGNRIFGGKSTTFSTYGIMVNAATSLVLYDNEVHGGEVNGAAGAVSTGMQIGGVSSFTLRHNTIHSGRSTGGGTNLGLHVNNSSTYQIANNLFLGEGIATAMFFDVCPNNTSLWENNVYAFTRVAQYGSTPGGACTINGSFNDVTTFDAEAQARGLAHLSNVFLDNICGVDGGATNPNCHELLGCDNPQNSTSASGATCFSYILSAYDSMSDGQTNLVGAGWTLKSNVLCLISKSMQPDYNAGTPGLATDFAGDARSASFDSVGADEYQGACAP